MIPNTWFLMMYRGKAQNHIINNCLLQWVSAIFYIDLRSLYFFLKFNVMSNLFHVLGEIEIADKYRSKRTLVTYKPVIYISNEVPTYQTSQEKEYWDANSITVQLQANQKLYEQ